MDVTTESKLPLDKLYLHLKEPTPPPILRDIAKAPPFRLNALLIMGACAIGLTMAGLLAIEVPDPYPAVFLDQTRPILYSFQVPFALFLGAFLGPMLGLLTVCFYLLTGLFFLPVFANGGGMDYVLDPGFGYLVGILVGTVFTGRMVNRAFAKNSRSGRSLYIIFAAFVGVFIAHLFGSAGLLVNALAGLITWPQAQNLWLQLSGAPMAYDVATTLILIGVARFLRLSLWLVLY